MFNKHKPIDFNKNRALVQEIFYQLKRIFLVGKPLFIET